MFSRTRVPSSWDEWIGRTARRAVIATLAAGSIATGLRAETPARSPLRLPADAVYERTVGADSAVVFRHATHVALAGDRCTGCHPVLFRILAPAGQLTHAVMNAGGSCGACHDGQHAFGVRAQSSCVGCHAGRPGTRRVIAGATSEAPPAGAFRGPKPIRYTPSDVSPGPVTFNHSTHAQGGCAGCHPRLFPMKSSAAKAREGMHEVTACGACHDGKQSFGTEQDGSCDRCHKEGAK